MILEDHLEKHFQLKSFRKGQKEIIQSVLSQVDALAIMPTGGGKSLCYQLPAVIQQGLVIVVTPLISLMRDQVQSLKRLGIAAGCLHSQQSYSEKKQLFSELKTEPAFLLYLSPERVQKEGFSRWIQGQNPVLFAIDEAHCISQWGHDFREDYGKLSLLRELRPQVPILALTATATPQVAGDIAFRLKLQKPQRHVYGFYRPNLCYQVQSCENEVHKVDQLQQAIEQAPVGRVLVYCGTRDGTQRLSEELGSRYEGVGFYHAGLSAEAREKVQKQYDEGKTRILCATNAFGMGIDHPDVRLVVHYQMPANLETYYQEIGRAGRDGNPSTCLLLYCRKDKGLQSFFIRQSQAPSSILSYRWRALDALVQYAEGGECRHGGILTYFRDHQRMKQCGHCDVCTPDSPRLIKSVTTSFRKTKSRKKAVAEGPVSPEVERRMEILRSWRLAYAEKLDIPAFLVFSNKTLKDLAMKTPASESELLQVYGMGEHKVSQFGEELLSVLDQ